jgi:hypothetical protein
VLVDRSYGEDSILSYVGVSVLETRSSGGEEGFDELGFPQLAKET